MINSVGMSTLAKSIKKTERVKKQLYFNEFTIIPRFKYD